MKHSVLNEFNLSVSDKAYDGIMMIEIKHKLNDFHIALIGVYLPPDNSTYGRDSSAFFSHLISLVYSTVNSDVTAICGDINARVGKVGKA